MFSHFGLGLDRKIDKIRPVVSSSTSRISDSIRQVDHLDPWHGRAPSRRQVCPLPNDDEARADDPFWIDSGPRGVSRQEAAEHVGARNRRGETRGIRNTLSQAKDGTAGPTA